MPDITLWGFDGSTYVRTVKMLLAENGVTGFRQVPLNVLEGEPTCSPTRARRSLAPAWCQASPLAARRTIWRTARNGLA